MATLLADYRSGIRYKVTASGDEVVTRTINGLNTMSVGPTMTASVTAWVSTIQSLTYGTLSSMSFIQERAVGF